MAVVSLKSTIITNRDATPVVLTDGLKSGGALKEGQGYVSAANGDSAGSKYLLFSVPSNARLASLIFQCEALGAGAKLDLGAYRNTADGGAVVDADFFASAVDVSAAVAPIDLLNESGTNTIDKQEMPLWQALGFSADVNSSFDIAATVNVAIAAAGKLSCKGRFAQ
jgi:hypothetical protein